MLSPADERVALLTRQQPALFNSDPLRDAPKYRSTRDSLSNGEVDVEEARLEQPEEEGGTAPSARLERGCPAHWASCSTDSARVSSQPSRKSERSRCRGGRGARARDKASSHLAKSCAEWSDLLSILSNARRASKNTGRDISRGRRVPRSHFVSSSTSRWRATAG